MIVEIMNVHHIWFCRAREDGGREALFRGKRLDSGTDEHVWTSYACRDAWFG